MRRSWRGYLRYLKYPECCLNCDVWFVFFRVEECKLWKLDWFWCDTGDSAKTRVDQRTPIPPAVATECITSTFTSTTNVASHNIGTSNSKVKHGSPIHHSLIPTKQCYSQLIVHFQTFQFLVHLNSIFSFPICLL